MRGSIACLAGALAVFYRLVQEFHPEIDPQQPIDKLTPMERVLADSLSRQRLAAALHGTRAFWHWNRRGVHIANVEGMRRAVAALAAPPGYVLTDGFAVRGLMLSSAAISLLSRPRASSCSRSSWPIRRSPW